MLNRDTILALVARRRKEEESAVFGGTLVLQEITRAEWRIAYNAAKTDPDPETGAPQMLTDVWYAHLFAVGVIGENGAALMSAAEVLAIPDRDGYPEEVARIAALILSLSDQEPDAVKKKSDS